MATSSESFDKPLDSDRLSSTEGNVLSWLATPPAADPHDELTPLRRHFEALKSNTFSAHQRYRLSLMFYARASSTVDRLLPEIAASELPLPRRTRRIVTGVRNLLLNLADDASHLAPPGDARLPPTMRIQALWYAVDALSKHLYVSYLAAAPATVGIWCQLHQAHADALRLRLADYQPHADAATLDQIYLQALLLGCAQPASFNSAEITLARALTQAFSDHVKQRHPEESPGEATFWVDLQRDVPPMAAVRVPLPAPPAPAPHLIFDCRPLTHFLEQQLSLCAGLRHAQAGAPKIQLPDAALTPSGQAATRRLIHYWGRPGKRRFTRRRQSYRSTLCVGLPALWQLFQHHGQTGAAAPENDLFSEWMITNESPDGYAAMHVSGSTRTISVGNVVAVKTEQNQGWQLCLVRWALSENPLHLELGLQLLASTATAGQVLLPAHAGQAAQKHPVLILPAIPAVRQQEALITSAGFAGLDQLMANGKMVLVIDNDGQRLEIREVRAAGIDEQTACIELILIEPDLESY